MPLRKKFIKVSACIMATSLLLSSVVLSWWPSNDKREAGDLLVKVKREAGDLLVKVMTVNQPNWLFADAGYDAEGPS